MLISVITAKSTFIHIKKNEVINLEREKERIHQNYLSTGKIGNK
jgi:hypothetical protein